MPKPKYYIAKDDSFIIENYNHAPPFSSFFPGIAGIYGCPMWVFYANRGQCITSAGIENKDGAIIEFQPANKAYRTVTLSGFRTFIKTNGSFYEPFCERSLCKKEMHISFDGLKITEINPKLKLKIEVSYFTIPNESFPALARIVKVKNLAFKKRHFEVIDGLPIFIPFGFNNDLLKRISQTTEAWCSVENLEHKAPFYRLKLMPADISETKQIEKGNYYFAFASQKNRTALVNYIVNPAIVFGETSSLEFPDAFINTHHFEPPATQLTCGFMPAAMSHKNFDLPPQGEIEICSVLGQADNISALNHLKNRITSRRYFEKKAKENGEVIQGICSLLDLKSSSRRFDLYSQQTFLDNTMRGGLPVDIGNQVFYLYYRKHGDMERDYNDFTLMPTYFSQGNGNYRDINQNRRNDVFFNPRVAEHNIVRFFNLIQMDGFNPLIIVGSNYYLKDPRVAEEIINKHIKNPQPKLKQKLLKPFILGSLIKGMETEGAVYLTSRNDFTVDLLNHCEVEQGALHGEGFWTDHFSYNTDLLESFEAIYPEKVKQLLFDLKAFTFFDNDHIVLGRNDRYCQINGKVRQFNSVKTDPEKEQLIKGRAKNPNLVRTDFGKGEIYKTSLIAKILCLIANKAASFDAEGIGLEMEADKPDWYDALNGLPGLLGSSLSETLELKRLAVYALEHLPSQADAAVAEEICDFIAALGKILDEFAKDPFAYWDASNQLKEDFRQKTRLGISGKESALAPESISGFLKRVISKCDAAVARCLSKYQNYHTYFINEATDFSCDAGTITIKKFSQDHLPLFLEGFVHALKVEKDKNIYKLVKRSPLFDRKLKMYKVNASLKEAPIEIGRAKIFTPGWLENESIWLHMEYKYMLELLKAGLYKEFFADFKHIMVPFMRPEIYKRSILENSSFIVSSANPNQSNHGRGFVARLSGGAAEFIDIWITMMTGKKIFYLDDSGKLCFRLSPAIPKWLFRNKQLTFKLLGNINVTYINNKGKDTYGGKLQPISYKLTIDNKDTKINASFIEEPFASLIRERKVSKIIVKLG